MRKVSEARLQYLWQRGYIKGGSYTGVGGSRIEILEQGVLNRDAGPDFSGARVRINGTELAGNIELHLRTSDWLRHGHQYNKSYDNIVLHVVLEHDTSVLQNTLHNVEILELKPLIGENLLSPPPPVSRANNVSCHAGIPCAPLLGEADDLLFSATATRMAVERLEVRVAVLEQKFGNLSGDYGRLFYGMLLRSFGAPVNAVPFEMLANALPLQIILRHADNLFQLEALILGMAGQATDNHTAAEFSFLSRKYSLQSLPPEIIKRSRMRPSAAPARRLKQFALLVHRSPQLLMHPEHETSFAGILNLLMAGSQGGGIGRSFAEHVIVNAIAPFLVFFGNKTSQPEYSEKGILLQSSCAPEHNVKVARFRAKSHAIADALTTQGLIHLLDNYCEKKRCLNCQLGQKLLGMKHAAAANGIVNLP